jgi:hypothetical protein
LTPNTLTNQQENTRVNKLATNRKCIQASDGSDLQGFKHVPRDFEKTSSKLGEYLQWNTRIIGHVPINTILQTTGSSFDYTI